MNTQTLTAPEATTHDQPRRRHIFCPTCHAGIQLGDTITSLCAQVTTHYLGQAPAHTAPECPYCLALEQVFHATGRCPRCPA